MIAFSLMKIKFLFVLLCLMVFGLSYGQNRLFGQIQDSIAGLPINEAQIMILESDQVAYADKQGAFLFSDIQRTTLTLKVVAAGYETRVMQVPSGDSVVLIRLKAQHLDLQEVTVSGMSVQARNQNAFHIETRKVSALNAIPTATMGELIAKIPGVYQSETGPGISKPVIRGLQGMRVVSLMNGMRIEGQQWGGDHGMGMAELGIGSVEVIKGPASLQYGADALGGVIHYTDLPPAAVGSIEGQGQILAQSATMGGVARLALRQSGTKWRYMVAGSVANHADFRLPNGKYAENTRFKEEVIRGTLSYTSSKGLHNLRYTYNRTLAGIPGESHDSIPNFQEFQLDEQQRKTMPPTQRFTNHFLSFDNKWFLKKGEVYALTAFTQNELTEFEESFDTSGISMLLRNVIYHLRYTCNINQWKWISGFMGMSQLNTNEKNATEELIPNSSTFDNGVYSTLLFAGKKFSFQGGARYDIRLINVFSQAVNRSFNFQGLNGSIGGVYNHNDLIIRTSFSTGFRAPHLTELLSDGFHHGALRYEIGDTLLKPEKATQLDVTTEWQSEHISLIFNPYVNYIKDFISLLPADSIIAGMPVFRYQPLSQVYFYGFDAGFHFHPHFLHDLHMESTVSFIDTYTKTDSAVAFIPQPRVQTQLKYELNLGKYLRLKEFVLQHTWMGDQSRIAFYELPSSSYNVIDIGLNGSYGKSEQIQLGIGCKNVLNENYIDHLSRLKNIQLPSAGRNFYLNVKYTFKSNGKVKNQN